MLLTKNLKLKKPEDNDILDPSLSINPNMDIIDNEIGKINEDIKNISSDATGTSYDNTNSKLTSTTVQGAIDEVNTKAEQNKTSISSLNKKTDATDVKVDLGQNHKLTTDDGTAILLNANFDLNTLLSTGIYNGTTLLHAPNGDSDWWYIEVMQHTNLNGYTYQKATSLSDPKNIKIFHRQMVGNVWGDWGSL